MESPVLPTPTSFDYHPPAMNARTVLVFKLPNDFPDQRLAACLSKAFYHIQTVFPITQKLISYDSKGTVSYLPGSKRKEEHGILSAQEIQFSSFAELKESGAPIYLFDDSIAPCPKLPVGEGPHPICDVKASRIDGGLILCFSFAHRAIDGGAMAVIMREFAKGCKTAFLNPQDEVAEDEETQFKRIRTAQEHALARERLRNLKGPRYWSSYLPDFPFRLHEATVPGPPVETHKTVRLFKISAFKLASLKSLASPPPPDWISTNDALSALIMRCVTRSRQIPCEFQSETINAHITVNARSKFDPPIPDDYMGNCVVNTSAPLPLSNLLLDDDASLAPLALALRKAVASLTPSAVEMIGGWTNAQTHRSIDYDYAYYGHERDYGLISWADWGLYHADFGFGYAAFSRQCATTFSDSCRIFPRGRDGSLEVLIGLEEEDMERLKRDEVWMGWMDEVGNEM